jgi:hypothetical protein
MVPNIIPYNAILIMLPIAESDRICEKKLFKVKATLPEQKQSFFIHFPETNYHAPETTLNACLVYM